MISQRQLFLHHQAQTTNSPIALEIQSAEGSYLYDIDGKKYIDLIAGISVSNTGHKHPKVIDAIKNQIDDHLFLMVYGEYIQASTVQLAEKLASLLPPGLETSYFVNSGSEAVEGALKLAKRSTGRTELISCYNAYHGSTHGALSVTGNEEIKNAYRPMLPDVRHINFNCIEDLIAITNKTAAVIIEVVQGEAGIRIADKNYFQALRSKCDETATMLIFDEIQTGFGRTGKMFAFEHYDIAPDILTIAKGMGGGMPIGAFISSKSVMANLTNNPMLGHISTFGGHPVSCAASLANINLIIEERLVKGVTGKARLFTDHLKHERIREIRQHGLMLAVELDDFAMVEAVIKSCIANGVVSDWFLFCDNSLRIAPPLNIKDKDIIESCRVIIAAIDAYSLVGVQT